MMDLFNQGIPYKKYADCEDISRHIEMISRYFKKDSGQYSRELISLQMLGLYVALSEKAGAEALPRMSKPSTFDQYRRERI